MDSIPSLRRQLAEARQEIAALKAVSRVEIREVVRTEYIMTEKEMYSVDPKLLTTIRELQERLRECQSTSQSGS